jgi:hypothetical protein
LRQLSGDALRTMSARSRRRLLSVALGDGRRRPLGLRAPSSALTLFLALRVPARRLITAAPGYGIGVVGRDGSSLAVVEPSFASAGSTVGSLRAFGEGEAEQLLLEHVRDWERRGRPSEHRLDIGVSYDAYGRSRVSARWPSARRP